MTNTESPRTSGQTFTTRRLATLDTGRATGWGWNGHATTTVNTLAAGARLADERSSR